MIQNQDLIEALKEEGKWITLMGQALSDQNIQAVGTVVNKLTQGYLPRRFAWTATLYLERFRERRVYVCSHRRQQSAGLLVAAPGVVAPKVPPAIRAVLRRHLKLDHDQAADDPGNSGRVDGGGGVLVQRCGGRQPADFAFVNRGDNKCLDPNGMSWMQDIRIAYGLVGGVVHARSGDA